PRWRAARMRRATAHLPPPERRRVARRARRARLIRQAARPLHGSACPDRRPVSRRAVRVPSRAEARGGRRSIRGDRAAHGRPARARRSGAGRGLREVLRDDPPPRGGARGGPLMSTWLDWAATARAYVVHGLHVFPLKHDKTPLTMNGWKDATTDLARLMFWSLRWPTAGIGLACLPS